MAAAAAPAQQAPSLQQAPRRFAFVDASLTKVALSQRQQFCDNPLACHPEACGCVQATKVLGRNIAHLSQQHCGGELSTPLGAGLQQQATLCCTAESLRPGPPPEGKRACASDCVIAVSSASLPPAVAFKADAASAVGHHSRSSVKWQDTLCRWEFQASCSRPRKHEVDRCSTCDIRQQLHIATLL